MVVDDIQIVLDMLCDSIVGEGFTDTHGFTNPFQAIEFIRSNPVDILITDYEMEGLNGIQLIDEIGGVPNIIMVSSSFSADMGLRKECFKRLVLPLDKNLGVKAVLEMLKRIREKYQVQASAPSEGNK